MSVEAEKITQEFHYTLTGCASTIPEVVDYELKIAINKLKEEV